MDCPCAPLDDALHTVDELRATVELLSRRIEKLIVQCRRQGLILPDALDGDDLFSAIELAAVLGISRARFYKLTEIPGFPPAVRKGRWSATQVIAWRNARKGRE